MNASSASSDYFYIYSIKQTLYLLFGYLFFRIINFIGSRIGVFEYQGLKVFSFEQNSPAFNFVYRIISPLILIIITFSLLSLINFPSLEIFSDMYWIILWYVFIRVVYLFLTEKYLFINVNAFLFVSATLCISSIFVVNNLFSKENIYSIKIQDLIGEI
jgi:hypothetical protein